MCGAQIQAIDLQPGMQTGLVHPLLMGLTAKRPTLTHKHQGGWTAFKRGWEQHLAMLTACNKRSQIPDSLLLPYFSECLEASDKLLLENMTKRNPHLYFANFWDGLVELYDRGTQAQLRLDWENVRLQGGSSLRRNGWLSRGNFSCVETGWRDPPSP